MSENFSLQKMKQLSSISDYLNDEAIKYLTKYFVPLSSGNHAMLVDGKYVLKETQEIKSTYFNRIDKKYENFYFKEYLDIKTITYKLNKPTFFEDYINLCPKMKHEYKSYETFSDGIKEKVDIVLSFIKNIWCSDNMDLYKFCIKWISNMLKGNKNNSCLYLKGPQGLGKSTIPLFLNLHVIGDPLCLESGSEPIKSKFNSILAGKLLVVFEELENFGTAEWQTISQTLKRMITSILINIQSKGVDAYSTTNINNYILISNNDAIQDDDGRRYCILDLCTDFIGQEDYFKKFYDNVFNDEVGHAFFCYMLEQDTNSFNPQSYPTTQSKKDSIAKRLDNTYKFLKNNYVLTNKKIFASVDDLYNEYKNYCIHNKCKDLGKIGFNNKMKEIGIKFFRSDGGTINRYKVEHSELLKIANKFKWIHELDIFREDIFVDDEISLLDQGIIEEPDYKQIVEEQKKQIKDLQEQINQLKSRDLFSLLKEQLDNLPRFQKNEQKDEPKQTEYIHQVEKFVLEFNDF